MAAPQDARAGPVTGFAGPVAPRQRAPGIAPILAHAIPRDPRSLSPDTRHNAPNRTSHPSAAAKRAPTLNLSLYWAMLRP
jgi:hypothetical protein